MIEIEVRVTCDECGATGKLLVTDDELVPTYKDIAGNQVYKLEATVYGQEQWKGKPVAWYHELIPHETDYLDLCHKCAPKYGVPGSNSPGSNSDTPTGWTCFSCGRKAYGDDPPPRWRPTDDGIMCQLCQMERGLDPGEPL